MSFQLFFFYPKDNPKPKEITINYINPGFFQSGVKVKLVLDNCGYWKCEIEGEKNEKSFQQNIVIKIPNHEDRKIKVTFDLIWKCPRCYVGFFSENDSNEMNIPLVIESLSVILHEYIVLKSDINLEEKMKVVESIVRFSEKSENVGALTKSQICPMMLQRLVENLHFPDEQPFQSFLFLHCLCKSSIQEFNLKPEHAQRIFQSVKNTNKEIIGDENLQIIVDGLQKLSPIHSRLGVLRNVYPNLITVRDLFWTYKRMKNQPTRLTDMTDVPVDLKDLSNFKDFLGNLSQECYNDTEGRRNFKDIIKDFPPEMQQQAINLSSETFRKELDEILYKTCIFVFSKISCDCDTPRMVWKTINLENKKKWSLNLCMTIEQSLNLLKQDEGSRKMIECIFSLCTEDDLLCTYESQKHFLNILARYIDSEFITVFKYIEENGKLLTSKPECDEIINVWLEKCLDRVERCMSDASCIFSVYSVIGEALALTGKKDDFNVGERAKKLFNCFKLATLVNETAQFESLMPVQGKELYFSHLLQFVRKMACEERREISENALKYWLSTDDERGFRTKMILAFLETTHFSQKDDRDSLSEILEWFEFWEKILAIEKVDNTLKKHKSYEYVKRWLCSFEERVENCDYSFAFFKEIMREENLSKLVHLCSISSDVTSKSIIEGKIVCSIDKAKSFVRSMDIVKKVSHSVYTNMEGWKAWHLLEEWFKQIKKIEENVKLHNLKVQDAEKTLFEISKDGTCRLLEYCEQLQEIVDSRMFWNLLNTSPLMKRVLEDSEKLVPGKEYFPKTVFLFIVGAFVGIGIKLYKERWQCLFSKAMEEMTLDDMNISFLGADFEQEYETACRLKIIPDNELEKVNSCINWQRTSQYCKDVCHVDNLCSCLQIEILPTRNYKIFEKYMSNTPLDVKMPLKLFFEESSIIKSILINFDDNVREFITNLLNAKNLLQFLKHIALEDLRNLIDAVEDYTEQQLSIKTMSNIIELQQFLYPLIRRDEKDSIESFIKKLSQDAHDVKVKNIYEYIRDCNQNLSALETLYRNVANRLQSTSTKVMSIISSGTFKFSDTNEKIHVSVFYIDNEQKTVNISKSELKDLRSRALLITGKESPIHKADTWVLKTKPEEFESFITYVDQAYQIATLYENLHEKGHFKYVDFCVVCIESNLLEGKLSHLRKELKTWNTEVKSYRKKFEEMRYLTVAHIRQLHQFLKGSLGQESVDAINFLIKQKTLSEKLKRNPSYDPIRPSDVFEGIKEIFNMTEMSEVLTERGYEDFVMCTSSKSALIRLLFASFADQFPCVNTVLMCDECTEYDEIHLFLARCKRYTGKIHALVNVEILREDIQYSLNKKLQKMTSKGTINRLRIILGTQSKKFLLHFKENHKNIAPISIPNMQEHLASTLKNVFTVTSDRAGIGKTEVIKEKCHKLKMHYKYLSINGFVNRNSIAHKLARLNLCDKDFLHLDIGTVENPEQLDNLLFQVLYLKYISSRRHSIFISTSHIYIEIQSTFGQNILKLMPFTMALKNTYVKWEGIDKFLPSSEINSPVQVVCHYLLSLDNSELHKKDLYFTGSKSLQPLTESVCKSVLRKFVPKHCDSYTVMLTFLKILSEQLKKLSCCMFYRTENLCDIRKKDPGPMLSMKITIVKTFLKMATKISKRSLSKTATTDTKTGQLCKQYGEPIRWEDINPTIVIFNAREIQTISILCKSTTDLGKSEKKFLEKQLKLSGGKLQDLDSLDQRQMLSLLSNVVSSSSFNWDQLCMKNDYVITTDNLLKMVIINLKVESFVPIILMGDTGCGKTTLLQTLAKIKGVIFRSLNIHAGLDETSIENKIREVNDNAFESPDEDFWLFIDEVNTNRNIGIFSDVIVHGHFNGNFLAPNVTVVAACNPYKIHEQKATSGLQGEDISPIYNVYPLPEAMLDFVWDFGNITREDEEKYIVLMINDVFAKIKCEKYPLQEVAAKSLSESQQFVRNCISSFNVSLREIERGKRLFSWFIDEFLPKRGYKEENYHDQYLMYWFMTLHLTYSSRFSLHSERTAYWKTITNLCKSHLKGVGLENIENNLFQEKKIVLNNMEMSSAIAVNRNLTENVFALFVCILSRIPVCLIGKPGCSKSLSIQLLRNNLRGNESPSAYFRKFPQLYFVSYQGSESSTPEGIEKVFKTAKHYQTVNINRNVQVVILFDELGLAAKSRFQPLNALHSILEEGVNTTDELTVSVIGLSNWAMDPAKMNRVLHVSCLDLTTEEMLQTAIAIYQNILEKSELYWEEKEILKTIATKYVEYTEQPDLEDFHCRRDFYSLIKYMSTKKREFPNSDIWIFISNGIKRNFGGLPFRHSLQTAEDFIITRKEMVGRKNVIDLIQENLSDCNSRHLMLISRSDAMIEKLILMLKQKKRKYTCIFGSQFEEDQYDDYNYRILSKIILCMEQGHVLVLKDLEMVYGSLFDMLNQNYSSIGERKHCRIALGPYSNPLCYVHEAFKCVVVVDKEIIIRNNTPLLSRFEKQAFSFQDSHCPKHDKLVEELEQILDEITKVYLSNGSVIHLPLKKLIPIHNNEMIYSLIQHICERNSDKVPNADQCLVALLPLFQPEAMILLKKSLLWKNNHKLATSLLDQFQRQPTHAGLENFIQEMFKSLEIVGCMLSTSNLHSSSTLENKTYHSNEEYLASDFLSDDSSDEMEDNLKTSVLITIFTNTDIFYDIPKDIKNAVCLKLGVIKSERQLDDAIKEFWYGNNELLVLQCVENEDFKHVFLAKSRIEHFRSEYLHATLCETRKKKVVCVIVHLTRGSENMSIFSTFNFQSEWKMATMDTLTTPFTTIKNIFNNSISEILDCSSEPIEKTIEEEMLWAFSRLSYHSMCARRINDVTRLTKKIIALTDVRNAIVFKIKNWLKKSDYTAGWAVDVACDTHCLETMGSFERALLNDLRKKIQNPLAQIVYLLEEKMAISVLCDYDENACDKSFLDMWVGIFTSESFIKLSETNENVGPLALKVTTPFIHLSFPFSRCIYEVLENQRDTFFREFRRRKIKNGLEEDDDFGVLHIKERANFIKWFESKIKQHVEDFLPYITDSLLKIYAKDFFVCYASKMIEEKVSEKTVDFFIRITKHCLRYIDEENNGSEELESKFLNRIVCLQLKIWLKESDIIGAVNILSAFEEYEGEEGNIDNIFQNTLKMIEEDKCDQECEADTDVIFFRCFLEVLCSKLFPRKKDMSDRISLKKWQIRVNTLLRLGSNFTTISDSQVKLRFLHDLACLVFIPEFGEIPLMNEIVHLIKEKRLDSSDICNKMLKDIFLHDLTLERVSVLTRYIQRCFALDDDNFIPITTVLKFLYDQQNNYIYAEKPTVKTIINLALLQMINEMNENNETSFPPDTCQKELYLFESLLRIVENRTTDLELFIADIFDSQHFSVVLNQETLMENSQENSCLHKKLFQAQQAIKSEKQTFPLMTKLYGECFCRSYIQAVVNSFDTLWSKRDFFLKQIRSILINANRHVPFKTEPLEVFFIRCLRKGSHSISLYQKTRELTQHSNISVLEKISDASNKLQNCLDMSLIQLLSEGNYKEMENFLQAKDGKKIENGNDKIIGAVLYLCTNVYIPQLYGKSDITMVKTVLNCIRQTPLFQTADHILKCFALQIDFQVKELVLSENNEEFSFVIASFVSLLLIVSGFIYPTDNVFLRAIEDPQIFLRGSLSKYFDSKCDCTSTKVNYLKNLVMNQEHLVFDAHKENCLTAKCSRLIVFGLSLACRALGNDKNNEIVDYFGKENDELDTFLVEEIESQWASLAEYLNVTENELLKLQMCILKNFSEIDHVDFGENSKCTKVISDAFENRYELIDELIKKHTAKIMERDIFEHMEVYLDETEFDMNSTILRRTLSSPSVERLIGEIIIRKYEEKYPFLYLLLSRLHFLRLLQLLPPILKWQRTIGVSGKYLLRKCECRTLSVSSFIEENCSKPDFQKVKDIFEDFIENWNDIFHGHNVEILQTMEPDIKPVLAKPDEKIGMFLVLDQSSQLLLVLRALIKIQNDFLDDVINIAKNSKCLPLSCFENPNASQIQCLSLLELQDRDILPHSFPTNALSFCQRSVNDQRSRIIYDFSKIESEVSVEYLTSAKFISLTEQNLFIQLKDDIFHSTILRLKALHQICKQTTDRQRLEKITKMLSENELDKNSNLLTVLGIVVAMVDDEEIKKQSHVSMIEYFKEYEIDFAFTNFEHALPTDAHMGDLVYIYETLEELNGERVIKTLEKTYREPMSSKVVQELSVVKQTRDILEKIFIGIKLFAHRIIWNNTSSISTEARLQDYMKEDCFWPVSISIDKKRELSMRMPKNIRVHHICHLFRILQSELKNEAADTKINVEEGQKLSIAAKAKSKKLKSRKSDALGKS